ncbi:MAG: SRPBCC family protein [Acidimicrobiia bacterium]
MDLAIEIPASPEDVFLYLSDLENNPSWNWAVSSTTSLDGTPRQGARFIQRRVWPRPGSYRLEISIYQPHCLLEVRGNLEEGDVRYRYELTASSQLRTRLVSTVVLELAAPMRRTDFYVARLSAAVSANLEELVAVFSGRMTTVSSG